MERDFGEVGLTDLEMSDLISFYVYAGPVQAGG